MLPRSQPCPVLSLLHPCRAVTLRLCDFCVCVCVCVCVCSAIYFDLGDSPSDQGETCTSLCNVFRGLHFAVCFSLSVSTNRGHTGGGRTNTGAFSSYLFDAPLPIGVPASIFFLSQEGFSRPSLVDSDVEFRQLTKLFSFHRFRPPDPKVRNNPLSPSSNP